jgi:hypothetical protein
VAELPAGILARLVGDALGTGRDVCVEQQAVPSDEDIVVADVVGVLDTVGQRLR